MTVMVILLRLLTDGVDDAAISVACAIQRGQVSNGFLCQGMLQIQKKCLLMQLINNSTSSFVDVADQNTDTIQKRNNIKFI